MALHINDLYRIKQAIVDNEEKVPGKGNRIMAGIKANIGRKGTGKPRKPSVKKEALIGDGSSGGGVRILRNKPLGGKPLTPKTPKVPNPNIKQIKTAYMSFNTAASNKPMLAHRRTTRNRLAQQPTRRPMLSSIGSRIRSTPTRAPVNSALHAARQRSSFNKAIQSVKTRSAVRSAIGRSKETSDRMSAPSIPVRAATRSASKVSTKPDVRAAVSSAKETAKGTEKKSKLSCTKKSIDKATYVRDHIRRGQTTRKILRKTKIAD